MQDSKNSKTPGVYMCNLLAMRLVKQLIEEANKPGFDLNGAIKKIREKFLADGWENKSVDYICKKIVKRFNSERRGTMIQAKKSEWTIKLKGNESGER